MKQNFDALVSDPKAISAFRERENARTLAAFGGEALDADIRVAL